MVGGAAFNIYRELRRKRTGERGGRSPPRGASGRCGRVARRAAWAERVAALAGAAGRPAASRPTYREVAHRRHRPGRALADAGRWGRGGGGGARDLKRFFAATPDGSARSRQAFDGLLAAALARDRDELEDFVDLVEALFP